MSDMLVNAFIALVVANLSVLAVVVINHLPPRPPRKSKRCECPCCRCGDYQ